MGSLQSHLKIVQKHWGRYNGGPPHVPSCPHLIKTEFVPDCVLDAGACERVNSRLRCSRLHLLATVGVASVDSFHKSVGIALSTANTTVIRLSSITLGFLEFLCCTALR